MTEARILTAEPRVEFDSAVEVRREDDDADYSGWYCVRTSPFPCPAGGCDFVAEFMTAAHLIIVWASKDDPMLLASAQNAVTVGRDPRVVEYEQAFGPCIAWDEWVTIGRPIHARLER